MSSVVRSLVDRFRHALVRVLPLSLAVTLTAGLASTPSSALPGRVDESPGVERYEYAEPGPGSERVSRWNNIVLREGGTIDASSLSAARLAVVGSVSGPHPGTLALSDDSKTLVFLPAEPFAPGEAVEVTLEGGIRTGSGEELPPVAFHFSVAIGDPAEPWDPILAELLSDETASRALSQESAAGEAQLAQAALGCGPLPASYPPISLTLSDRPDPGHVFLSPFRNVGPGHLVIVDNLANPIFYRRLPLPSTDFKLQPDGRLSYFSRLPSGAGTPKFMVMDESYAVVDSFATGNGYVTDSHEFLILPNGHALLMSYDPQPVRMDLVVSGGRPNAIVVGLIVQELDRDKNVVFQWRSWDHFQITDVASPAVSLTGLNIDYVHGNAIELDHDGDLLVSSRHLNEITKISRQTGAVLWRMGLLAKNNQFTFANDTRGFSHQHDIRRLPNGHIALFDNGNFLTPQYSRALEFEVDEAARRATLVWEYRRAPDVYGSFMGNVQRRADGGTMVGWGGANTNPRLTDLRPDGTRALELGMAGGTWSYRAFRFPWRTSRFVTDATALDFGEVRIGESASRTVTVTNPGAAEVTIDCVFATDALYSLVAAVPATLAPGGSMQVEVRFGPTAERGYPARLYLRTTSAQELIAQDVELNAIGVVNRAPDCSAARATPAELWPPSHELKPIEIAGVTDPDGDPVTIEVRSVTQDEDLRGGDGSTCPDARVEGGGVSLRAERSGTGDGRVYHIAFTARDPAGRSCEGEVSVCVPHDRADAGPERAGGIPQDVPPESCLESLEFVSALGPCPEDPPARLAAPPAAGARAGLEALPAGRAAVTIEFSLPAEADVTLGVFDLAGRRVATLDAGRRGAGTHRAAWNTAGVPAGMYFCRLRGAGVALTKPLLVVQ